jgi:tetratricopeptide (TPR) repeat protein
MRTIPGCPYCGGPHKEDVEICYYCGKSIEKQTTVEEKRSRLSKLSHEIGRKPPSVTQMLELGELTLGLGQNHLAVDYFRAVIKEEQDDPHPHLLLLLTLLGFNQPRVESEMHAREIGKLIVWLKESAPNAPSTRWVNYYLELQRLSRGGDWPRAIAFGKKSIEEFPDNYLLHAMLAAAMLRFGKTEGLTKADYQGALKHMRIAAEIDADYTPAVNNVRALEKIIAKMS